MTDESTSARALIAAYRKCARPTAAAEAQLWARLAAAERAAPRRPRPLASSRVAWGALAAGLLLFVAWQLDLPRYFASGHVLKDMSHQAEHDVAPAGPATATARGAARATVDAGPAPAADERREPQHAPGDARPADQTRPARGPGRPRPRARDDDGDRVLAEMALLQQAQAALRGGRPGEALELLARHAETFARGSMAEERQALRVLALCAAGEVARGSAEADTFLRAHPRSAYATRVAEACPSGHDPKDGSTNLLMKTPAGGD
jgi:hypothetical protein